MVVEIVVVFVVLILLVYVVVGVVVPVLTSFCHQRIYGGSRVPSGRSNCFT